VSQYQDPYGSDFLEQMARTQKRTLESRLRRINVALQVAVPQLSGLKLDHDAIGKPHLAVSYINWPPNVWQTEEHFSDGTLRLLGILWALLEGGAPLLLEEPELSLHPGVVRYIPTMMASVARKNARQVFVSTHSADLLSDEGIAAEEVVLLVPSKNGTLVQLAANDSQIRTLLANGISMADVVLPRTEPRQVQQLQLSLFGS